MTVTIIKKDGEKIVYKYAYDLYELKHSVEDRNGKRSLIEKRMCVLYPDELDYNVEAEMEYNTDTIDSVVITFTGE